MNWNDNVELFIPSNITSSIVNIDGTIETPEPPEYTAETLPSKSRNGRNYIMVTLRDRLQETCCDGQDALILLENGSVRLRRVCITEDTIILKPLNTEFYEEETYPKDTIQILGVVEGAVRIN